MARRDRLSEYRTKRDAATSPEPVGRHRGGHSGDARFVVQRHDASSLHFDFRLAVDGVLASWSVPKGPSLDPRDKRLAIRTEDHPLEYADFEGTIPHGEYGGGTVIVWDTGTYRLGEGRSGARDLDEGKLTFELHGEKLTGGFTLVRTDYGGKQEQWLLMKRDDEAADRRRKPARTQLHSVLSDRTNEELE